jgi:hypothetical protein
LEHFPEIINAECNDQEASQRVSDRLVYIFLDEENVHNRNKGKDPKAIQQGLAGLKAVDDLPEDVDI